MLKIKDGIDLKELEKYGFKKLENDARGHKYSWKEIKNDWYYEIYVAKDNRISMYVESLNQFRYIRFRSKMQEKLFDLATAGLLEKVEE